MASRVKRAKAKPPKPAARKPAVAKTKRRPVKRAAPRSRATPSAPSAPVSPTGEPLGSITCPSGTLGIFDIGLMGYLPRPALEPAIVKARVPANRELRVIGELGEGKKCVLLVGHNPELTELAHRFSRAITHMPTCAVGEFAFAADSWPDALAGRPARAALHTP